MHIDDDSWGGPLPEDQRAIRRMRRARFAGAGGTIVLGLAMIAVFAFFGRRS